MDNVLSNLQTFTDVHFIGFIASSACVHRIMDQRRSQGLSSLPPLVVGTETLVAAGHVTIYPSKTAAWVGTQLHLVERTIKYYPGEGKLFWCLVLKHDFSAKTTDSSQESWSSDIPLSPCLSKFVTVTIKKPCCPTLPADFSTSQILRREERPWERG